MTENAAAELVVDAIEAMALDSGYIDPGEGISRLREERGLQS